MTGPGPDFGRSRSGGCGCGDSQTATHGALGALAFGIGASEVSHVLATQTLWQSRKPRAMRGTSPEDAAPVTGMIPDPADSQDAERRGAIERALAYMGFEARYAAAMPWL